MFCPLCLKPEIKHYHQDKQRDYWQCKNCQLVFVAPEHCLDAQAEKAIYDQHQNNPDDLGYRTFLNKLLIPLTQKLKPKAQGLDFGSGPGPTLSVMMSELGFNMRNFDIFYDNNPETLKLNYDFITCTEVIEHLYQPHQEISKLTEMLKPNGLLGIMTKRIINQEKFKNWHYKNDPTHVCFYSDSTFEFIANFWGYDLEIVNSDTVILKYL